MQKVTKEIIVKPIAFVKNSRKEKVDDNWGEITSEIVLNDELPESCFDGIEEFSHIEVIFYFDKSTDIVIGSEHPRENSNWPKVGIFAQRKKDRPNHLGLTVAKLLKREGRILTVSNLDAIDGTPVLDIKPVFDEFMPKEEIIQPDWSSELMKYYW